MSKFIEIRKEAKVILYVITLIHNHKFMNYICTGKIQRFDRVIYIHNDTFMPISLIILRQ